MLVEPTRLSGIETLSPGQNTPSSVNPSYMTLKSPGRLTREGVQTCGSPESVASAPFATMLVPGSCCIACMPRHTLLHDKLCLLNSVHAVG